MRKKKVFISGPMSGIKNWNHDAFMAAEKALKQAGYSVFNPAWLLVDEWWSHAEIMAIDIAALDKCDMMYQLNGWQNSKGAREEFVYATTHGIDILEKLIVNEESQEVLYECER